MRYRKKPVVIDATRWHANGDHPDVTPYPRPLDCRARCCKCDLRLGGHGWIDTLEGGHIVCPGDFIVTGVQGEKYPCKTDIFAATYEAVT